MLWSAVSILREPSIRDLLADYSDVSQDILPNPFAYFDVVYHP
jgi:hypothetical protein